MRDLVQQHELQKHCCPPLDFCPIPWWQADRDKPLSNWFEGDDSCRVSSGVQFPSRARMLAEAYCVPTFFDSTCADGYLRFDGDVRQHADSHPGTLVDYLVRSVDGNAPADVIESTPKPDTAVRSSSRRRSSSSADKMSNYESATHEETNPGSVTEGDTAIGDDRQTSCEEMTWREKIDKLDHRGAQKLAKEFKLAANGKTHDIKASLFYFMQCYLENKISETPDHFSRD